MGKVSRKPIIWTMLKLHGYQTRTLHIVLVLLMSVGLIPKSAFADSITALATGSPTPSTTIGPIGTTVRNRDFEITRTGGTETIGDGINEKTTWVFDFAIDPNFSPFSSLDSGKFSVRFSRFGLPPGLTRC